MTKEYREFIAWFDSNKGQYAYPMKELIRCRECRHFMNESENYPDEYGNYPTMCMYMPDAQENDFCSKAEREEE